VRISNLAFLNWLANPRLKIYFHNSCILSNNVVLYKVVFYGFLPLLINDVITAILKGGSGNGGVCLEGLRKDTNYFYIFLALKAFLRDVRL